MQVKTNNPALDTFIDTAEINYTALYATYLDSYSKIHKYANKIRKEYTNTKDKEKIAHRKIVYDAEKEILETIIAIESYLPYEKRAFTHNQENEIRRLTFNKASNVGFVPCDNEIENVEDIIGNKLVRNELLYMMKDLLTKKQYTCMYMYYWERVTQEEIAKRIGVEHNNVSAYIKNSIEKIRNSEYFISFLKEIN